MVPSPGIGARIEQFERVDAGSGRAGDVADVVGAGALGGQAEIDEPFQEGRPVLGRDLATWRLARVVTWL